jgi:hypothetical protein
MGSLSLVSLALLKTNMDSNDQDVLDLLLPLASYAAHKARLANPFSSGILAKEIESHLGLRLPERAVQLLLKRLQRLGHATRNKSEYTVTLWPGDLETIEDRARSFRDKEDRVVQNLAQFAQSMHARNWTIEDARRALEGYIDEYSIDCIQAHEGASPLPVQGKSPRNSHFVVSSYGNRISTDDPILFDFLIDVVKGRMLTNAVLGSDLVDRKQTFKGTQLALDTPLLIRLTGLEGEDASRLATDVVKLAAKAGATWIAFSHTLDEADGILRSVERGLDESSNAVGYGDVFLFAKRSGWQPSDITLRRAQLPDTLEARGIQVIPTPVYLPSLQIDEPALETCMHEQGLRHANEAAARHDINSVRSIYVLRRRATPRRIEACHAALVTTNAALARAAFQYGKRHESSMSVSTVVTEYSLAALLWLKVPLDDSDVPKHLFSATCHAALQPSPALWHSFLQQVDKLRQMGAITAEQHAVLRSECKIHADLAHMTLGDENALDQGLVMKMLSAYEDGLAQPYKDLAWLERERRAAAEADLAHSSDERDALHERLRLSEEKRANTRRAVRGVSQVAGFATRAVFIALACCVSLVGTVWAMDGGRLSWTISGVLFAAAGVVSGALQVGGPVGWSLKPAVRRVSKRVERGVEKRLCRLLNIEES